MASENSGDYCMYGSVGDLRSQLLQLVEELPISVVLQNKTDALAAAGELSEAWRSTRETDAAEVIRFIHQAVDQLEGVGERFATVGDLVSAYANGI
ncbi:hypothetical protein GCM10022247_04600 [Allokutzneria multivorans]|uniref:Uncharacterized protein n=1 Tax=Allokutzneria multivorans TaxID=1142134 RepID=A0ABP7QWL4_9PSEU